MKFLDNYSRKALNYCIRSRTDNDDYTIQQLSVGRPLYEGS